MDSQLYWSETSCVSPKSQPTGWEVSELFWGVYRLGYADLNDQSDVTLAEKVSTKTTPKRPVRINYTSDLLLLLLGHSVMSDSLWSHRL